MSSESLFVDLIDEGAVGRRREGEDEREGHEGDDEGSRHGPEAQEQ